MCELINTLILSEIFNNKYFNIEIPFHYAENILPYSKMENLRCI